MTTEEIKKEIEAVKKFIANTSNPQDERDDNAEYLKELEADLVKAEKKAEEKKTNAKAEAAKKPVRKPVVKAEKDEDIDAELQAKRDAKKESAPKHDLTGIETIAKGEEREFSLAGNKYYLNRVSESRYSFGTIDEGKKKKLFVILSEGGKFSVYQRVKKFETLKEAIAYLVDNQPLIDAIEDHAQKAADSKERVEKRKSEGKPVVKTAAETQKTATKAVVEKVEKKVENEESVSTDIKSVSKSFVVSHQEFQKLLVSAKDIAGMKAADAAAAQAIKDLQKVRAGYAKYLKK